jgi:hypothetical protein
MSRRSIVSCAGAVVAGAALLTGVSSALAAGNAPKVSVRIEGANRTLLPAHVVRVPTSGFLTRDGAPKGKCPADSAAGVLNEATHGRWGGTWSSTYDDYLITRIDGQYESGTKAYWEILVNDVAASSGACAIRPRAGEQLLFAVVPLSGTGYPLVIQSPTRVRRGSELRVKVDAVNGRGRRLPLSGVSVTDGPGRARTNAHGIAILRPRRAGTIIVRASRPGYIRAEAVRVKVLR